MRLWWLGKMKTRIASIKYFFTCKLNLKPLLSSTLVNFDLGLSKIILVKKVFHNNYKFICNFQKHDNQVFDESWIDPSI
jgi:hypothetical protein